MDPDSRGPYEPGRGAEARGGLGEGVIADRRFWLIVRERLWIDRHIHHAA